MLVPIESPYIFDFLLVINTDIISIFFTCYNMHVQVYVSQ